LTKRGEDTRLYLNKMIQWSSIDEHRYHEALVHIPMMQARHRRQILILGGGEGLAVRELLKYPDVEQITIVDLDQAIFDLATEHPIVRKINEQSLSSEKVIPVAQDAYQYLQQTPFLYDLIIIDLPDPSNESLARLYSREFYQLVSKRLAAQGLLVTQATSPFFNLNTYWCIENTMEAAELPYIYPYHAYVPSFGDWGFMMASKVPLDTSRWQLEVPTQFLEKNMIPTLFYFPKDFVEVDSTFSTLDRPAILEFYLDEAGRWNRMGI